MKKFFVSVGLIAAGTASLQAAYAPVWDSMAASMWSVSGTLRGFYDDNYTTSVQVLRKAVSVLRLLPR